MPAQDFENDVVHLRRGEVIHLTHDRNLCGPGHTVDGRVNVEQKPIGGPGVERIGERRIG